MRSGLHFVGVAIRVLSAGRAPGHFVAGDYRDLWETFDGGKSWQVLYFGAITWDVRAGGFSLHRPNDFWLITSAEILKLVDAPPERWGREVAGRFRTLVEREPTAADAITKALQRVGAYRPELNAYRSGARLSGLLPTVKAAAWRRVDRIGVRRGLPAEGDFEDVGQISEAAQPIFNWVVLGTWDLTRLVHSRDETI